jgi:hypothetical protein
MRVIVTVTEGAAQELYVELGRIPSRQRAERLRSLAALGLALVRNPGMTENHTPAGVPDLAPPQTPPLSNEAAQLQSALKSRLTQGLDPGAPEN